MKREYSIKVDGVVLSDEIYCRKKDAENAIRIMEESDRVYDNPWPPKRCIVAREVSAWKPVKG